MNKNRYLIVLMIYRTVSRVKLLLQKMRQNILNTDQSISIKERQLALKEHMKWLRNNFTTFLHTFDWSFTVEYILQRF